MNSTPRPTSVTVFGILNIVFAGFGVVGILIILATIAMVSGSGNAIGNDHISKVMRDSPAYMTWIKLTVPLSMISCVMLLTAGIGLLRMKSWGRHLSIGYGIYAIVFGIIGMIVSFFFFLLPLIESASRLTGPESGGAIGGAVGGLIGGALGLVYPALLIFFMMRPKVVAAFKPPQ